MTIQDTITAQTLSTVKQAQDFALAATTAVAERVTPYLPKLDTLPFVDSLPAPAEVVEKAFDFTSLLLAGTKNLAVGATKAWTAPTSSKPAPKAAKAAPKPVAE